MLSHKQHATTAAAPVIARQQRLAVAHRFVSLCQQANLDPVNPSSVAVMCALLSRYRVPDADRLAEIARTFALDDELDAGVLGEGNVLAMAATADWEAMLAYLEPAADAPAPNRVLAAFRASLDEALVMPERDTTLAAPYLFALVSIDGTPAREMLENHAVKLLRQDGAAPPHDLQVRAMRALTSFHDHQFTGHELQATLTQALAGMSVRPEYVMLVREALRDIQADVELARPDVRRRPRLADIIQEMNRARVEYHGTFDNWAAHMRFPLNTSVNMQRLLYFLRVQEPLPDAALCLRFFPDSLVRKAFELPVDLIDAAAICTTLRAVRSYKTRIPALIDFRARCLQGLTLSMRSALTLAQATQLYIAAYQHESVSERCWRVVVDYWNYTTKNAIAAFITQHRFAVEEVAAILHDSLSAFEAGEAAPAGVG